jgi:hypothetical protein
MVFWLEIVTLVIPGFNDSDQELTRLAEFLAGVSPDIPWHVTAFHKDYKMTDPDNTSPQTPIRAAEIGKKAGLRLHLCGQSSRQGGRSREHPLPRLPRTPHRTIWVLHYQLPSNPGRPLPEVQQTYSRTLGPGLLRPDHVAPLRAPAAGFVQPD